MWLVFTAIYAVWMCFFMKADTYPAAETGILKPIYYPIWVVGSCVIMLLYIILLNRYLYGELGKGDKAFALISLIFGCVFITWYGFFKNPFEFTASMIGLEYPWHFKMWGIFAPISIFVNTIYMLILTSLRCMSHWTGALVFAFCCAAPIVMFLLHMAKTGNKKFIALTVAFCAVLVTMLVLLATLGKDGIIESLPMWATYLLLFLVNFTSLFDVKKAEEKQPALV